MNSKNVIFVHPMDSFFPSQCGGIRYLINSLITFLRQGWSAIVIGTQDRVPNGLHNWVHIPLVNEKNSFFRWIPVWVRYLLMLYVRLPFMTLPIDAVIITHRMDCMLAFVLFKPKNPKLMISATPAHYLRTSYPLLFKVFGWIYRLAERVCVGGVDAIVTTDLKTKNYYLKHYPWAKLTDCIPSAINFSNFQLIPKVVARQTLGWQEDVPLILFVGRLAKIKNLPLLVRAFAIVENQYPDAQLYILGTGESESEIKELAKRYCKHVNFVGAIPPEQLSYYYSAANLLVLCSLEEGSPTVIKESLACGTSVVSTDVGDASLVLSSDSCLGQIVLPDDYHLAAGIITQLNRDDNNTLREQRRRAVQRYGTEATGSKLIALSNMVTLQKNEKLRRAIK